MGRHRVLIWFVTSAVLLAVSGGPAQAFAASKKSETAAQSDRAYLLSLARDTWNCLDYFRAPATGLPYDSNLRPDTTNTTNVGLYLISVTAAHRLKLLTKRQALERIGPILATLEATPDWRGFFNNHLNVNQPKPLYPGPNAISDFNKLAAAFIVLRRAFPELETADRLFRRIDWSALWNSSTGRIGMGYDAVDGTLYDWGDGWFASDARTAVFLGVATEGLPVQAYTRMERRLVKHYGLEFYHTAWNYGGLFMHAMGGLLLDERFRDIGKSTANFGYAQMLFARRQGYPAWGWSAGNIPGDGYTIDGRLSQGVVAPYASALVIGYYPGRVVSNLRFLDALGARPAYRADGREYAFGFRDSINLTTGEVSDITYSGTQAMLFIALANYLQPGCIQRLFESDPVVQHGLSLLDANMTENPSLERMYAERDAGQFPPRTELSPAEFVIDDGRQPDRNRLGKGRLVRVDQAPENALRVTAGGGEVRIEFDLTGHPEATAVLTEPLDGLPETLVNAVSLRCRFDRAGGEDLNFRLAVLDRIESRAVALVDAVGRDWTDILIPFESFRGIVADPEALSAIEIRLERQPQFLPANRLGVERGTLQIRDLTLRRLSPEVLKSAVLDWQQRVALHWEADGRVAGFARMSGWQNFADADAGFQLKTDGRDQIESSYHLGQKGRWVAWEKTWRMSLPDDFTLAFEYQYQGFENQLEVKFFSPAGAVFGKTFPMNGGQGPGTWRAVTLSKADLPRLWGGRPEDLLSAVDKFGFAVSGNSGTEGTVRIRHLRLQKLPAAPVVE